MGSAIVVEPEPLLRAVFCSILQQLGFDATGVATLESLSSKTLTHISLLLLQHPKDQAMLFKILSASAAYPQTQFVIAVDSDDSLPAHSANLVVIRKPFQLEEMATALSIR